MTLPTPTEVISAISGAAQSLFAPFSLEKIKGFPYIQFNEQLEMYQVYEQWYKGEPLEVTITDKNTNKPVEKYPIKINPLKGTCKAHAARVIGQNTDSIRFAGVPFVLEPDVDKAQKVIGEKTKDALLKIFTANGFGASFLSTCIRSQYLGGSILASKWLPLEMSVEISTPSPKECFCVPDGANFHRLREAWIVKEISESDARALGYVKRLMDNRFWYIEHWTKTDYRIQVNDQVVYLNDIPQEGPNPYKKVPVVYIPHIRVDNFLGDSIVTESVKGIIREINIRWADIGDAVGTDAHDILAARNVNGTITPINVGGRIILDLGSQSGIGGAADPDLFTVGTKSASDAMLKFVEELYQVYRRETSHPAVADGEDEGSQRSSLTLSVRMAPLVDEAEFERLFWTIGILEFINVLLNIMLVHKQNDVTKEMLDIPFIVQWQPMLPRDHEALSTMAAVRSKNKITSNKQLNRLFGDVRDTEEDAEEIKDESKALAEIEAKAKPQPTFGGPNNRSTPGQTKP
jgi:hypothetical protein